jgi:type III restriction enzyme
MNKKANYIKQRLSLRAPLQDSLDIVAQIADVLTLNKEVNLDEELAKIQALYPTCNSFEREFPSLCFSIATGVGKTRLMGACISYLYLEKGIRNFFVLAPNLTIYEKLVEDFGNPANPKYVFNGIGEFVHNRPMVITGDNYDSLGGLFSDSEIRINVFNISKFNKDAGDPRGKEKGKLPRIKRLAEYLGKSYWEYLSGLNDLVILMDEAHRYKADASAKAINELKPILGLELTATPIDERGNAFKNIVFEYNLAQALADGKYVKNPAIAYRSDFQTQGRSTEEIERVKLEDAISLHEHVKTELEVFANSSGQKKVKPFVLVVCRDIAHSKDIQAYIQSSAFYNGQYADKVIQIDSSINDEENAFLLETVEQYDNPVEIVIHVNMLAEGWDVTNLYTICPLRAADSVKLIEQTIGRGLRLPYNGERTGVKPIDQLTVIAHDNFQKVIDAAQDPNSVLNRFSFIKIDENDAVGKTVAVEVLPIFEEGIKKEQEAIAKIESPEKRAKAQVAHDARSLIIQSIPELSQMTQVARVEDMKRPEVKAAAITKLKKDLEYGQQSVFKDEIIQAFHEEYDAIIDTYGKKIIEIPRIMVFPKPVSTWFEDFDLDTSTGFDLRVLAEEIKVRGLVDNQIQTIGVKHGANYRESPANQLVSELLNFPHVDYESSPELINKLVQQALKKLSEGVENQRELQTLIRQSRKLLAHRIHEQMKPHFRQSDQAFEVSKVLPFDEIKKWNFGALAENGYKDFRLSIPARDVPKFVYMGFKKACHGQYKFDSGSEKLFAQIIEEDIEVLKWLRPTERQFILNWGPSSRNYVPDFVVETFEEIYIAEVKAANEIASTEVQEKKKAAEIYCAQASAYNAQHNKKPWKYIIVPHDKLQLNVSFNQILNFAE